MKQLFLLAFLASTTLTYSQEKLKLIDVDDLLIKADEASEKQDYKETLLYLDKIPKNDSLHCTIISNKSYYLLQDEQYDKVIELSDEGIEKGCYDDEDVFHINKAAALISSEKYEEALASVEASLKIFPYSTNLWYNKAFALENLGNIEAAAQAYMHNIAIDPLDATAHLQLGNLCFQQEQMAQALMCYNMYMLLSDTIDTDLETLTSLNNVVAAKNSNTADPNVKISEDDATFKEIDLILTQQVALNSNYKTGNKINVALVNQNHALFTSLKKHKGKGGFWDKKYVPFYQWIMATNNFDYYTYYITQSVENASFKRIINKNKKETTEFAIAAIEKWMDILSTNEDGPDYYYNGSYVQAVGESKGDETVGPFTFYNEDGRLVVDANFDDKGEKTGLWKWYYNNGQLKESLTYKNGKKEGENLLYFDNGKKYISSTFKDDEFDGEYKVYNSDGALMEKKYYKKGKIDGPYISYFSVGEILKEYDVPYKNGEVEGEVTEYHANGEKYLITPFKETKRNGIEKKYNSQKNILSEIGYKDNELEGIYKIYYPNGKVKEEGKSVAGYFNGPWKIYYDDGTLNEDFVYDNGLITGTYKNYNPDGTLAFEYQYRKGEIIEYTFYDRKGEVINNERKKGGEFYYTSYTSDRIKTSEGLYDISGGKTGDWKFYSSKNGVLETQAEYKDNKAVNKYIEYYPNGQKKSIRNYKEDVLDGYYVDYYANGKMNNQTYYKEGAPHGYWHEYFKDGTLKYTYYYHKGELYGEQIEYDVDGNITQISNYDQGTIVSSDIYNKEGKIYQTIDYKSPGGSYVLSFKYPNGQPYITVDYVNGKKHGQYIKYYLSGKKMLTGTYLNNMQDGEWTWFYEDGTKEVSRKYHINQLSGETIIYFKDGTVRSKRNYAFDEIEGNYDSFFETGKLKARTPYKNGIVNGRKENFDQTGKLQLVRFFEYDRLIGYSYLGKDGKELPMIPIKNETGKVTAYYDNGNVSREFEYKNGDLIGTYKNYYYDGSLYNSTEYDADLLNGMDIEYYPNGTVKEEQEYLYDDYHGFNKKYYENGTLKEEIPYKLDNKHGVASYYSKEKKLLKEETYHNGVLIDVKKY